ncbi:hypothetical protein Ancab_007599, partial [Ancistrocladus abbreviatus]
TSDFRDFDLIRAMDKQNRADMLYAFDRWEERDKSPADACKKKHDETEVPDPYYGGRQGFEKRFLSRQLEIVKICDSYLEGPGIILGIGISTKLQRAAPSASSDLWLHMLRPGLVEKGIGPSK